MEQTIYEFLEAPFGAQEVKSNEFEAKYNRLASDKKIHMEACTKIDDKNYLVHIKVGSESSANSYYDVVILFYTNDVRISKDVLFTRYYVKFFSNSPSFIYQYAALYREKNFLIDALDNKLDALYKDKMPEKRNPSLKVSYDKSIYAACRFMLDHKVSAFTKVGVMARKKKKIDDFFKDIKNFEDIKFNSELSRIGRKVENTAAKDKDKNKVVGKRPKKGKVVMRVKMTSTAKRTTAKKSTVEGPPGITGAKRSSRITGK